MGVVVDTSVLIASERGTFDFDGFVAAHDGDDIGMAAITASEVLRGLTVTRAAAHDRRAQSAERMLDALQVAPFGLAEARIHARLWAELARQGKLIGPHDMLIAATALSLGSSVATLNSREFRRVHGLKLEPIAKWARPKRG